MDKGKAIRNKLRPIFCNLEKRENKYVEVWLSYFAFGLMHKSNNFILNVCTAEPVKNLRSEIQYVLCLLDEHAKEELKNILQVNVWSSDEDVHCSSDEILIYSEDYEEQLRYILLQLNHKSL